MAKKTSLVFPKQQKILNELGENIKLARLRRKLSSEQVAERAGIGRSTLIKLEQGNAGLGLGNLLNVLSVLGLENDLLQIAKDDELGRKIQDANLLVKERVRK